MSSKKINKLALLADFSPYKYEAYQSLLQNPTANNYEQF